MFKYFVVKRAPMGYKFFKKKKPRKEPAYENSTVDKEKTREKKEKGTR